jgi:hypothetical protein
LTQPWKTLILSFDLSADSDAPKQSIATEMVMTVN